MTTTFVTVPGRLVNESMEAVVESDGTSEFGFSFTQEGVNLS